MIHGLSQFPDIDVHVICLSGMDAGSVRPAEFEAAKVVAGYKSGVVMGGALRPANQPLPPIAATVRAGMGRLGLTATSIDILITHSPFGEEHMHPHHMQACTELYAWTVAQGIPFGYFTCLPLPTCRLQPMLANMKRLSTLQLLNYASCSPPVSYLQRRREKRPERYPRFYLQWLVDAATKRAMLACYPSIDLTEHARGYAMFDNNVESLYLFDQYGANLFERLMRSMEVPGSPDLFADAWINVGVVRKLARNFMNRIT